MSSVSQVMAPARSKQESRTAISSVQVRRYLPMYLSIAPYFIVFLIFGAFPVVFSAYLAFQSWDGIGTMEFVGWNNFYFALTDPVFGKVIFNTFAIWIISTIPMLVLALVMAFLLNQRTRSKFAYQVCFYLPNIASIVAITLVFNSLFGEQYGLLNIMLTSINLPAIPWLTDFWGMKWSVALISIWMWTGYNSLIYMAGLQSIPSEYYEAARTDGANTWHIFFRITLPLLRPIILFTVITSTIGGLSLFTEPFLLFTVNGGTDNQGMTMVLYQFQQVFDKYYYGYGAAVGWVIFAILLAFTFINWKLVQRGE